MAKIDVRQPVNASAPQAHAASHQANGSDPTVLSAVLANDFSKGGAATGGGSGDTALADVTGMAVAVAVSATYEVWGAIGFDASATGDIKIALTLPTGATMIVPILGPATTNANNGAASVWTVALTVSGTAGAFGSASTGSVKSIIFRGTVTTDATHAGSVQVQMAQNDLDGTNASTVKAGSFIAARRLS